MNCLIFNTPTSVSYTSNFQISPASLAYDSYLSYLGENQDDASRTICSIDNLMQQITSESIKSIRRSFVSNFVSIAIHYESESQVIKNSEDIIDSFNKLKQLANLEENWDHNGAKPFTQSLIETVSRILFRVYKQFNQQPDIFPTARNSIQLEYEDITGEYLELEVFEDKIYSLYIDTDNNEFEEVLDIDYDQINRVVSRFRGRNYRSK